MSDVFRTVVSPIALKATALVIAAGSMDFSAERTTDVNGNPPATHCLSSGYIPAEVAASFDADARFVSSTDKWYVVCANMGLHPIVQPL